MKRTLPLLVVVVALSGAGCYQILGLGSFANCNGGNVDAIVPCNAGASGPGGGGTGGAGGHPTASSSSTGGGGGGTGPGGGGGAGGGTGPACQLTNNGMPATVISATEVPGANWHSFFMLAATASDKPVIFAVFDRTSSTLYMRGVSDLSSPQTELISYAANGNGDIDLYGGAIVGGNLVLHIRDTNVFGDLLVPIQSGHLQQTGITFTPYNNLPAGCTMPPAYPRALAVDEADGSAAYTCSDNGSPDETFSLYLDGQLVDSAVGDDSAVNATVNHKFANGKRMILSFGQHGSYYRLGTDVSSLATKSLLKFSAQAASDIELVAATTPKAYGMNDFVLIGFDVPSDFSSSTLYSGRVAASASALAATPPTGSKKGMTTDVNGLIFSTQADSDGSTIVIGGQDPTGAYVHIDVFDNDGKPLVTNFEVVHATTTLVGGMAVHAGLGSSFMAGWADSTQVQAISMFCSLK